MATYGLPARKLYPLTSRRRVHAAIAHFAKWQGKYPRAERSAIAANIRAAARRYGIAVKAF